MSATARFEKGRWVRQVRAKLASEIDWRTVFEDRDGAVWFGAGVGRLPGMNQLGGVLRYDPSQENEDQRWKHFIPPEAPIYSYGLGQSADGNMWFGGGGLRRFDGKDWHRISEPKGWFRGSTEFWARTADSG